MEGYAGCLFLVTVTTWSMASCEKPVNASHEGFYSEIVNVVPRGVPLCDLYPHDEDIHRRVERISMQGNIKLLVYDITLPEYEDNPLLENATRHFKADQWHRVFSHQGRTLFHLGFNYEVLSLKLLTFGVKHLDVKLYDAPKGCFGRLDTKSRVDKVQEILMEDFSASRSHSGWIPDEDYLCYEVINRDGDSHVEISQVCCTWSEDDQVCETEEVGWIMALRYLVAAVKIAVLFFGPLLVQKCFFGSSGAKAGYEIPLHENLTKTMLLKKIRIDEDSVHSRQSKTKKIKEFCNFRQTVKSVPSDEVVAVNFKKLHVLVDHRELMSESEVPVGVGRFLYDTVFCCGMLRHQPFASCCAESIFGSWSKKFLWFKLLDGFDCNRSCKKFCSWAHLFQILGAILLMTLIVLPYVIRSIIFYAFEDEEMAKRKDAVDLLDLTPRYGADLFQWLSPSHGLFIAAYIAFIGGSLILLAFFKADPSKVEQIVTSAMTDLGKVSCIETLRMLSAHILLPFEKFGLLCGFLVGALYWPFALSLGVLTFLAYCIPTFYLTGRFFITSRLPCLRECPLPTLAPNSDREVELISKEVTSFEACLLLNNISPNPTLVTEKRKSQFACHFGQVCGGIKALIIGLILVINMYILLLMYAEVCGFLTEVLFFTLLGATLNASSAAKFVIIAAWIIAYCLVCFNSVHASYKKLSKKLFSFLKERLSDDIDSMMTFSVDDNLHSAFKYFTTSQIMEFHEKTKPDSGDGKNISDVADDVIADKSGRLFWNIKSLVLFIDSRDVARIPKKLFTEICQLDLPGCLGSLHSVIYKASKQFLFMMLFMTFVILAAVSMGEIQEISDTNQVLLILMIGCVPLVVKFIHAFHHPEQDLNTFSFHGKIHQVIFNFAQQWPVFDLEFETSYSCQTLSLRPDAAAAGNTSDERLAGVRSRGPTAQGMFNPPDIVDPTHVDLLITIRDEEETNLRSEADSHGSLHIGDEASNAAAEASTNFPGVMVPSTSGVINNPTNAFFHKAQRRAQQGQSDPKIKTSPNPTAEGATAGPSTESVQSPSNKRVDLVVDLAKSGVQVRGADSQNGESANGIPMWPISSPYKKMSDQDGEAPV